jgi:hypothetical protein
MFKLGKAGAEEKPPTITGVLGQSLLGLGTGIAAGYGLGRALEAIGRRTGIPIPVIASRVGSVAGATVGAGYPLLKAYEQQELQRALAARRQRLDAQRAAKAAKDK